MILLQRNKIYSSVDEFLKNPPEVNKIALVAPHASINIIHNYTVVEKLEVKLPKAIEGIVKCVNPCCISNSDEPVVSKF